MKAIKAAAADWVGGSFARSIAYKAEQMCNSDILKKCNRIYLLTSQKEDFKKLRWEKLLGMAHMDIKSDTESELTYFQVKPNTIYEKNKRKYKNIGSKMIETLKNYYVNIVLLAFYKAANFYNKQGFKLTDPELIKYTWKRKNINTELPTLERKCPTLL